VSFTPGPWVVVWSPDAQRYIVESRGPVYRFICRLGTDEVADGRLIAAAPDMLLALEAVHKQARSYHEDCGHGQPGSVAECDAICECLQQMRTAIFKAVGVP
jgi:hypothetical protein